VWKSVNSREFTWIHGNSREFTWKSVNFFREFTWIHVKSREKVWKCVNSREFTWKSVNLAALYNRTLFIPKTKILIYSMDSRFARPLKIPFFLGNTEGANFRIFKKRFFQKFWDCLKEPEPISTLQIYADYAVLRILNGVAKRGQNTLLCFVKILIIINVP
jgi:hypothetical protein